MAKLDADIAEALQQEKDHTNKAEAGKWRDYGDGLKVQHRELDGSAQPTVSPNAPTFRGPNRTCSRWVRVRRSNSGAHYLPSK